LIRQTLSEDLASRVPPGKLVLPDAPMPPDSAKLIVTIDEFGVSPGGRVALNGSWSLLKPGQNTPRVQRGFEFETPADGSASEQAAAMSELLGRLASAIAQTLAGGG
jgi:uncharacterized lipoprotein YmbA